MSPFASNSRFRLGRAGTTALEFALCGSLLFMLLIGSIDLGRYYITAQSVRELAGDVARAAVVDNSLAGCLAAANQKQQYAQRTPMLSDVSKLEICINRPAVVSSPSTITISVSYPFSFIFWLLRSYKGPISETTKITVP